MNPYQLLKPPARAVAPTRGRRMYAAADMSRLEGGWQSASSSADAEINQSLRIMRNRSRQLVRDNEYAANGVRQVVQNVIGGGIGLQAIVKNLRGTLQDDLNEKIHEAWMEWYDDPGSVHTAGIMSGTDIDRYCMSNIVEGGEGVLRLVQKPFGKSKIPLAIELVESDRIIDNYTLAMAPGTGNPIRMGIEVDNWHRPQAYWCWPQHPGDYQFSQFQPSAFIREPAENIIHQYVVDRWPQTRGVPWFHAAMRRLNNMAGYEEAEIVAARGAAAIMGFIEAAELTAPDDIEPDGKRVIDMEPGQINNLLPGEKFTGFNPGRPNAQAEPFMRLMIRGVASAIGMSYETLSRDYTNTNYSSARASQIEDRDNWKQIQTWYIKYRRLIYIRFLEAAVLAGRLSIPDFLTNQAKYVRAHFVPRGWSWIDPQKEVNAYLTAVRAGFMTQADVIAQTNNGRDAHDVLKARRRELDQAAALDLVFDTDPAQVAKTGVAQPNTAPEEETDKPAEPGEDATQSGGDSASSNADKEAAPAAAAKQPAKPAKKAA